MTALKARIDRYFGLSERSTTVGGELRAAATTFLTMAYVLVVNPSILGEAVPLEGAEGFAQLLTVTALAAAVGSVLMGLLARYPFALAPGMGLNAYFAYTVVLGDGVPWQVALGAVFFSGLVFIALSMGGVRAAIVRAIPRPIQLAIAAGIGLFLAIIGARNGGLVVDHPATLVALGDVTGPPVLLTTLGLVTMAALLALKVRGAILIGIVIVTVVAMVTGAPVYDGQAFAGFEGGLLRAPVLPTDLFGALDLGGALQMGLVGIVFTFTFVDLFDTAGTLIGLGHRVGVLRPDGDLPRASHAFTADALATTAGAVLGTSSTTSYIESAAGIEAGGRTGLTAVFVGLLFALAIFVWPLFAAVPAVATAPALIVVGAMMMGGLRDIPWDAHRVAVPAFLTLVGMPLTFSIANGIAFGLISWVLIHLAIGRWREVPWLLGALAALLIARYAWLAAG
ncbi:MAG: guanine permease [Proteobacteria bacterium]|nr:MAG: guanine permease [Pseudomonadota bacterium]